MPADQASTTTQRILEATPLVPPSGALAGWAAACVLGVDLLGGLDPYTMRPQPVSITLGRDVGRSSTSLIRYVRDSLPDAHREQRDGVSVTTPFRTAVDGARWAANLTEAVVFLDQIAHAMNLDLGELAEWLGRLRGCPGSQQARASLLSADEASASPWESRLRMFYRQQASLPKPLVNRAVFDLRGRLLGIADLLDVEAGLVTEFDGQDHRARRQHRKDNLREEDLEFANLVVCRVDSLDLRHRLALTDRLRARHAQAMSRDRRRDAWTIDPPDWWLRRQAARSIGSVRR